MMHGFIETKDGKMKPIETARYKVVILHGGPCDGGDISVLRHSNYARFIVCEAVLNGKQYTMYERYEEDENGQFNYVGKQYEPIEP
jgi:hypothetical protein